MDKLTFVDTIGDREFSILNSSEPVITFCEHYFPLKQVFPYVSRINWDMGYMIASGRVMASMEATDYIKTMDWVKEEFLLGKLN